jgi:DNA-binding IclR family transcriptional regulator
MTAPTRALSRAIDVLFCFAATRKELGLAELAEASGLSKATLLRYLEVLRAYRLVERTGSVYQLGIGSFELGSNFLANLDVLRAARRFMEDLAASCSETVSLAIADGAEVVYTDIARGQAEIGVQSRIGARQPAHCSAVGKVLLAWTSEAYREEHLYRRSLVKLTIHSISERGDLEMELKRIRAQGFAYDEEERSEGIRCVGAPIRDYTGAVVAALSVSGAAFRMQNEHMDRAREGVLAAADGTSAKMGWQPRSVAPSRV